MQGFGNLGLEEKLPSRMATAPPSPTEGGPAPGLLNPQPTTEDSTGQPIPPWGAGEGQGGQGPSHSSEGRQFLPTRPNNKTSSSQKPKTPLLTGKIVQASVIKKAVATASQPICPTLSPTKRPSTDAQIC